MTELPDNRKSRLGIPVFIGLFLGSLIAYDSYIVNLISIRLLQYFPYEFSAVVLITIIASCIFFLNINRLLQNKEFMFILLLLVGYQTNAIQLAIIDLSDVTIAFFALILFLTAMANKEHKFIMSPVNYLNIILLLFIVLSFMNQIYPRLFLIFIKSILLFFLIINLINKKEHVITFVKLFIIVSTCSALIAIIQEIVFMTTGYTLAGFISAAELLKMTEKTPLGSFYRVPGFMLSYAALAKVLVINFILIINILLYPVYFSGSSRKRALLYIALFLTLIASVLTFSKDALLAVTIGFFISIFLRWPSRIIHFLSGLLVVIIISYYSGLIESFIDIISTDISHGEARMRIELDRKGIEGFIHDDIRYMLFGKGMGHGGKYTSDFRNWPAHNNFILAANEIGISGLLAYISIYIFIVYRLFTSSLIVKEIRDKAIIRGLLVGFSAIIIMFQFYAGYIDPLLWLYAGLVESMALVLLKEHSLSKSATLSCRT